MQFKTPIEEFVPEVQDFIKQFIRKARAPNFEAHGYLANEYTTDVARFTQVAFKDPRFPKMDGFVGTVTWGNLAREWTVRSRTITNNKYRRGHPDYTQKTTKEIAKALKIAATSITPFAYYEVMLRSDKLAIDAIKAWRQEGDKYSMMFNGISAKNLYQEVKRLKDMGVAFITPDFQKIADEGIDLYELAQNRRKKVVLKHHVMFIDHNRVAVTAQEVSANDFNDKHHDSKVYESFEQLPEEIATNVAMLKMLNDGNRISGVGVRVSANEYYVFVPLDSSPKGWL